jgi:hypothetical protein
MAFVWQEGKEMITGVICTKEVDLKRVLFGKTFGYKQRPCHTTYSKTITELMDNASFKDVPELFEVSALPSIYRSIHESSENRWTSAKLW